VGAVADLAHHSEIEALHTAALSERGYSERPPRRHCAFRSSRAKFGDAIVASPHFTEDFTMAQLFLRRPTWTGASS